MIKSWQELWHDPQFTLKIFVLVIGTFVNIFILETADRSYYAILTIGYHYSFLSLVIALLIASIWFGTTMITEVSLLTVATIKLVVCTITYTFLNSEGYENYVKESDGNLQFHFVSLSRIHRLSILMVLNITSVIVMVFMTFLRVVKN